MKKFASVLLAVLVAFSMFSFVVSAAAPSLTVSADKTTVKAGDVVTVTVKLSEGAGLGTITYVINYDATAFKATEISVGGFGNAFVEKNAAYANGQALVTAAASESIGAGTATLKLEALKSADSTVSVTVTEATDANFKPVDVSANTVAIKGAEAPTDPTDPTDPSEHVHTMSTWAQTKAPTCKEAGLKERSCTVCGETEKESIPATGKCTYKWVVTKEATEKEYGEKQLKCTMCGEVKETQKLAVKQDTITNPAIPNTDAIA